MARGSLRSWVGLAFLSPGRRPHTAAPEEGRGARGVADPAQDRSDHTHPGEGAHRPALDPGEERPSPQPRDLCPLSKLHPLNCDLSCLPLTPPNTHTHTHSKICTHLHTYTHYTHIHTQRPGIWPVPSGASSWGQEVAVTLMLSWDCCHSP